jgi:cold shock CspA family protein
MLTVIGLLALPPAIFPPKKIGHCHSGEHVEDHAPLRRGDGRTPFGWRSPPKALGVNLKSDTATVKWFSRLRGFGILGRPDKGDIWFPATKFDLTGVERIRPGLRVQVRYYDGIGRGSSIGAVSRISPITSNRGLLDGLSKTLVFER